MDENKVMSSQCIYRDSLHKLKMFINNKLAALVGRRSSHKMHTLSRLRKRKCSHEPLEDTHVNLNKSMVHEKKRENAEGGVETINAYKVHSRREQKKNEMPTKDWQVRNTIVIMVRVLASKKHHFHHGSGFGKKETPLSSWFGLSLWHNRECKKSRRTQIANGPQYA